MSVTVSVEVPVGFKIRTADGTSINHIEGSNTATAKDVAGPSFDSSIKDQSRLACATTLCTEERAGFREHALETLRLGISQDPLLFVATSSELLTVNTGLNHS